MRELRLFAIRDDDRDETLEVTAIHDETGYRALRQALADQYNLGSREPNIQVFNVDRRGNRSLTLRHFRYNRRPLGETTNEMLKHLRRLWGFAVRLESVDEHGRVHPIGLQSLGDPAGHGRYPFAVSKKGAFDALHHRRLQAQGQGM